MNIIPKINHLEEGAGTVKITAASKISCPQELMIAAEFLNGLIEKSLGVKLNYAQEGNVCFSLVKGLEEEAYRLNISETKINIEASAFNGAFYAVQSLRQLMDLDLKEKVSTLEAPCLRAEDSPRFKWRGLNFDEARHFFGGEEVKRLLDLMAMHKLNVLHWHLTDDQGWRIEIKKYPRLTEIGSMRKGSAVGGWHQNKMEEKPHGGFYTQEEIKEIVQYAAQRGITIVPEIDMPAHFTAAFAAYPWLACREIPVEVPWHFGGKTAKMAGLGDWNRSACIGKDTTFEFVFGVLDEIFELFPGQYIHIGGDEAPKDEWKKCPLCQKRMEENDLANVDELQGYFSNRVNEYVKKHGKYLINWNEALAARKLDNTVLIQYWTPQKDRNVRKFLERGGKIISCKHQAFYFDMGYAQYPLRNTYFFEKKVKDLIEDFPEQVLGLEGHLWTEWVADREKIDLSLFPRMEALAESSWGDGKNRDYGEFKNRMYQFEKILDKMGVNYAVDQIADPKNPFYRLHEYERWSNADQYREVRKNRVLKQQ